MNNKTKEGEEIQSAELIRIILELRLKGWTDTEILDHLLAIEGYQSI